MRILVTGGAGFVGSHVVNKLGREHSVTIIDSLETSYGGSLSFDRLATFPAAVSRIVADISVLSDIEIADAVSEMDLVIHLAAWAGVRSSLSRSHEYFTNNVIATEVILKATERTNTPLMLASSSSVYGDQGQFVQCREEDADGVGLRSPYAISKWIGEIWARGLRSTQAPMLIVRPFSIYGPWGRPDMAYFAFARRMIRGESIHLLGNSDTRRDFTYIDDASFYIASLAEQMVVDYPYMAKQLESGLGVPTVNICNGQPAALGSVIQLLGDSLGTRASIDYLPASDLDLRGTHGDPERLHALCGRRQTSLEEGIASFVQWMLEFQGTYRDW